MSAIKNSKIEKNIMEDVWNMETVVTCTKTITEKQYSAFRERNLSGCLPKPRVKESFEYGTPKYIYPRVYSDLKRT